MMSGWLLLLLVTEEDEGYSCCLSNAGCSYLP